MKKKKRILGILLSLVLVLSLMPGISLTVYAEDEYESLLYTEVKFDGKDWYLIEYDDTNNTVTLLSKGCVASSIYDNSYNTYSGSKVEGVVDGWYETNISENEKKQLLETRCSCSNIIWHIKSI